MNRQPDAWSFAHPHLCYEIFDAVPIGNGDLGARQIPTWAGCRGLSVQYITRDPNQRHLF